MTFPENILQQYPTGLWGFVGDVRADLAFVQLDGSLATDAQLKTARKFGPRLTRLKPRAFTTKALAIEALDRKGGA